MVVVCVVLLWQTVGPAALAGLAVLLVLLPINAVFVGGRIRKLQVGVLFDLSPQVFFVYDYLLLLLLLFIVGINSQLIVKVNVRGATYGHICSVLRNINVYIR